MKILKYECKVATCHKLTELEYSIITFIENLRNIPNVNGSYFDVKHFFENYIKDENVVNILYTYTEYLVEKEIYKLPANVEFKDAHISDLTLKISIKSGTCYYNYKEYPFSGSIEYSNNFVMDNMQRYDIVRQQFYESHKELGDRYYAILDYHFSCKIF